MNQLSHVNPTTGQANMVDVGNKPVTQRSATAEALVMVSADLAQAIRENTIKKGDVLAIARIAGITGAKRTADLIPLCHQLPLDSVHVDAVLEDAVDDQQRCVVRITATANTSARTGVEMEALTAATIASLTVYDMGKAIDKAIAIQDVRLLSKTGGRSGDYHAPAAKTGG